MGNIPQGDLKKMQKYICANKEINVNRWYKHFWF